MLIDHALREFLTETEMNDTQYKNFLIQDIKSCYYKYLTTPQEYFLFGFKEHKDIAFRSSFLTDNYKIRSLIKITGEEVFYNELTDKMGFFQLTKTYFRRNVFKLSKESKCEDFMSFVACTPDIFVKPLADSFGKGAKAFSIRTPKEAQVIYNELTKTGKEWIVEQKIIQSDDMAQWNSTSVNTIRIPSFLYNNEFHIVKPVMRFGRKGSLVDNAGGGGLICCVDRNTGKLVTDGADESGRYYKIHPDSEKEFLGWNVPDWSDLMILVEEIHRKCMPKHRYIGWDFAHTSDGWVLIEGNWGQFLSQYVDKIGVRKDFDDYIGNR